ncbi:TPA: prepilin-type N-terminal cleavage/methylation domain-containing protein [Listeria monocytogenes]|uniref:competence type IV pilus minor pilin ComGD n=1 Tax=Listeria monocytogenes TaxID=1639 RepID=UPI0008687760|nr:competence type IV pilus minor pilin ComGD [Listeria monocytogenes]EDE2200107.1 prepilin-type N-terminal cleavage/methylation domain-containing protein [Listeria monocytogenes]OER13669.1 competence protein ComG [Listeria monocytogenes]UIJ49056.1 prepilin-type N-terminal cleavage/methylation domain-containing protein [Listeria monocytogenes]HAA8684459.1 competence protein ComG [Listeria monocytogenes]HAA8702337.1 competence protein ComG [Listeria monocytogenes]
MKINGFTLLEMLLVLTISFTLITLITLTIFPISSTLSTLREKQLLEEIKASIYYAQINAVATNQDTFISFDPTKNQLITYTNSKTLVIIPFSQTLTLTQPKIGNFRFSSTDGSINRFSTIHLTSSTNNYKLIFQIGKGRFRIEQN